MHGPGQHREETVWLMPLLSSTSPDSTGEIHRIAQWQRILGNAGPRLPALVNEGELRREEK